MANSLITFILQAFLSIIFNHNMRSFAPVTHVIFDLDGLLLDTESIYKIGLEEMLQKYGKVYSDDVRIKIVGTKEIDLSKILVKELNIPTTPEEFLKEFIEHFKCKLKNTKLKPGAEKLIRHFHKSGVPMAVATSSGKETCAVKLERYLELFSCLSHIVMGSSDPEVIHGKPAPDIFLIAAQRFADSPSPDKCLVFEDSYNGVLAANTANMQVVMVPESLIQEDKKEYATSVIKSLENFDPAMFGLPPFDDS